MADDVPSVARGEAYRRPSVLERVGARLGRLLPAGAVRRGLRSVYRAVIGLGSDGRGVRATLPGGEVVRLLPEYRFVTWNEAEYEAFRAAVHPGDVVLDVGANVGAYALVMGRWVRPGGRVYAFEPAPDAFEGLRRHVALNGLEDTVHPVRAAAAGAAGRAGLRVEGISGANRLSLAGEAALDVETVTIDGFCAREGVSPAVIKIDVEGAELEVLRGAERTIRAGGPGLALFVEMHPTLWRELGISPEEVRAELARQGLRAEPLRPSDDPWGREGECLRLVRI